jgi:hypothetical protein
MAKFRVPRKTKKKIKKDLWFYPFDEKLNRYRVAFPSEKQEEYNDWKNGVLLLFK